MAKTPQQRIIQRYHEHKETIHANKLSEIVSDLWLAETEKAKTKLWGKAQVELMRMGVDPNKAAGVVAKRDIEALAQLVAEADAGTAPKAKDETDPAKPKTEKAPGAQSVADGRTIKEMRAQLAAEAGYDSLEEDNLKRALRAFRRKLKTLRRDDESRLGNRYVTAGRKSTINAIQPPKEYPTPVWERLVELRRLNRAGQGTYELPD